MPQQPIQGLQQMQTKLVNAPAQSIPPIVPQTQQTGQRIVGQLSHQPQQQQIAQQQQPQQQISLQQQQQQSQTQQQQSQQEPTAAEINLMLNSLGLGLPPNETLQLANWDLKKLAMYLVSNRELSVSLSHSLLNPIRDSFSFYLSSEINQNTLIPFSFYFNTYIQMN